MEIHMEFTQDNYKIIKGWSNDWYVPFFHVFMYKSHWFIMNWTMLSREEKPQWDCMLVLVLHRKIPLHLKSNSGHGHDFLFCWKKLSCLLNHRVSQHCQETDRQPIPQQGDSRLLLAACWRLWSALMRSSQQPDDRLIHNPSLHCINCVVQSLAMTGNMSHHTTGYSVCACRKSCLIRTIISQCGSTVSSCD